MSDVKINVDAGVCRFKTVIAASLNDEMEVVFSIKSECPKVREFSKNVKPVSMMDAVAMPYKDNDIYNQCGNFLEHAACPVPCAMVKAAEAASDLALKKDVVFNFE